MKRIIALLTMFAMLLSFTAVSADNGIDEKFMQLMNRQLTEGNVQMKMQLSADSTMFEMLGTDGAAVKGLLNSSVDYNLNAVANDEQTKMQADGRMMFNSGAEQYGIPSFGLDVWANMDIENLDNMQYFIIMKVVGESLEQSLGDKYIVMDYTKIPGFKEIIKGLAELGLFNKDKAEAIANDIIDEEKLTEFIARMYEGIDINPVYADGKYSVVMGDAEVKSLFVKLFDNLINLLVELSEGEIEAELADIEEAKALLAPIANVQLFDAERGIVIEISEDGNVMHMEINLAFNIYEIAEVFDPASVSNEPFGKSTYDFRISLAADANITPLPEGYTVQYPALDGSNSIDVFSTEYGRDVSFEMIEAAQNSDDVIEIVYNGNVVELENRPMIINDRTFVPFRRLANMLGIDDEHIGYDEATQKVYLKSGDIEIEMYIGSSVVYVNGEMKVLDVPAFTCNDRTYIPVRFVSEMFGRTVGYDEVNGVQTISIND